MDKNFIKSLADLKYGGEQNWFAVKQWLWDKHRLYIMVTSPISKTGGFGWLVIEMKYGRENPLNHDGYSNRIESPAIAEIDGIKRAVKHLHSKRGKK